MSPTHGVTNSGIGLGNSHDSVDTASIVLGLRTLGTFDFEGHSLLQFVRHCADNYLHSEEKLIRLEAVRTCSALLRGTLLGKAITVCKNQKFTFTFKIFRETKPFFFQDWQVENQQPFNRLSMKSWPNYLSLASLILMRTFDIA